MNKRDYFAAQALQAIIAKFPAFLSFEDSEEDFNAIYEAASRGAYNYADAMMYVREEGK